MTLHSLALFTTNLLQRFPFTQYSLVISYVCSFEYVDGLGLVLHQRKQFPALCFHSLHSELYCHIPYLPLLQIAARVMKYRQEQLIVTVLSRVD